MLRGSKSEQDSPGETEVLAPVRRGPAGLGRRGALTAPGVPVPELSGHWQMVATATGHWKASRRTTVNEVPEKVFPLRQRNGLGAAGLPGSASRKWPSGPAPGGIAVPPGL